MAAADDTPRPRPESDPGFIEPPIVDRYPPNTTEGIQVEGRGLKSPTVRVTVSGVGFVLHIDDAANPETWVQVYISEDVVEQWSRFAALRSCDDQGDVTEPPEPVTE